MLPLPDVILNVGLITSYDSAAYHDFISELKRSGYPFKIFLVNSIMQGKNTEDSVIKALKILEDKGEVDVIVITRGGGSIAELSCFDSEKIVLGVAQSGIPVLSGIGHEINTTVTDLAAHTFAKTPTAIAKFLVERLKEFIDSVDERAFLLQTRTLGLIKSHHQRLAGIAQALKWTSAVRLKESGKSLGDAQERLKKIIYLRLQNSRTKIAQYQKLAQMADPKNTLKRGFSITRSREGSLIRSIKDIKGIKDITTQLVDGIINSELKD
jgi:exodeoxyribonuclease VII large subunit